MYLLFELAGHECRLLNKCPTFNEAAILFGESCPDEFEKQDDGTWYHGGGYLDGFMILHVTYRVHFSNNWEGDDTKYFPITDKETRDEADDMLQTLMDEHPGHCSGFVQKVVHQNRKPKVTQ